MRLVVALGDARRRADEPRAHKFMTCSEMSFS